MSVNTVSGTIYNAFDAPMAAVTVNAYDKDLRLEQLVSAAITDAKGFYKIEYDGEKYTQAENKTLDIFIRVFNTTGGVLVVLGASPVNFNVPTDFTLDFKIDGTPYKGISEFDALVNAITPLLENQQVTMADLKENEQFKDITFLAAETGEAFEKIAFLPIAFSLTETTRIAPDIYYGLFRENYPTDLKELLLVNSKSLLKGLEMAINDNIISSKWESQLDSIIQNLNTLSTNYVLTGTDEKNVAFQKVLGSALPDVNLQQTFINTYFANESTPEKFWDTLSQQPGFNDPNVVGGIQSALQLNLLTNNTPSLTASLFKEQQQNPALKDMRGFASFTKEDWYLRINQLVAIGDLKIFPPNIKGNTPEEKAVNYAYSITLLVKTLYPTDTFASRLSKDTSDAFKETKTDLTTFFANNIDYDLKNNNINKLFEASNLTGVQDKQSLEKELTSINLVSKLFSGIIDDDYSYISAMCLDGINSATALVNKYTPDQFAEKFAPSISAETAAAIYTNAQRTDNASTVLALSLKMRNDIPVYAINGATNDAPSDYESMFGDTSCDCEYCQSVYSASAYFVDILNIINKYNPDDAFAELITRRPDLTQILLTCKNTNTPLPYIDLVNELLENTIAPIPPVIVNGVPTFPQYQTTNSAEELLAYPEHVDTSAYDLLKTANSAFNLPLDLPLEETRLYLDKLGVSRYGLMELFFGKNTGPNYNDLPIAVEYLQLSQGELNIVNGTTPMPVTLGKVTDFLANTGLTYIEMLQLRECYFVNPLLANGERSINIVSTSDKPDTCKIEDLKLQTTDQQSVKIIPFIRLWRKTGWDIFDLDRAFTAFGVKDFIGDVNKKLIVPLSHIARLREGYYLSVANSITLWSNIDTAVYFDRSLEGQPKILTQYESLFQNKQVTNPLDPAFDNPGSLTGTLAEKAAIIIAALNLSQKDFDTLGKTPFVDGKLTLENLGVLFRYTLLARTLKISVDELITAIDITGINPFGNSLQSADTLAFIDKVVFIRSTGFSLSQLNGLLTNSVTAPLQIDVNNISTVLTALREGLKKIELLDPVGATPQEQAKNKLQNQNSFIADTLSTDFKTASKVVDVLINSLVKSVANNTEPAIKSFIDAVFIASEGPLFTINTSNVITWIFPDLFNTYVSLSDTWKRISILISKLKISSDEFVYLQSNEAKLNISGIFNLPVSASSSILFPRFENLFNIIRFRNALAAVTTDWFTIFDFAISNGVDAKKNFINSFIALANYTLSNFEFLLGSATDVTDTGFLKYAFPSDYLNGAILFDVINCVKTAAQLGSSADNIAKLTIANPTDVQENDAAALLKSLLKSKYDVPTWLSIITPLNNQLRVKKRDALISYILTSPKTGIKNFRQANKITDTNSLYACFLIDMEMDACMLTSRIVQATNSVQLFVDRCLMNLEAGIVLSNDFTTQWNTWRKRYRVWEANRKIFLYPENWIEPELRDDKSAFFKELESTLRQNDITDETAEDALRNYLEKLDTVANLQMVGVYPDNITGIVHVIGRTKHIPHKYFYTKKVKAIWSAWEKVELDIEGDHILPVVWNNRLMLYWGMFTEKQEENGGSSTISPGENGTSSLSSAPAAKYWEIKLAWSEYKNGKWTAKKISKDAVSTLNKIVDSLDVVNKNVDKKQILLASTFVDSRLYIKLHAWAEPYRKYFDKQKLNGFYFDNCNSSPSIAPNSEIPLEYFEIINNTNSNAMVLDEREQIHKDPAGNDTLSIYNTGLCKMHISQTSDVVLFNNTPGTFQLLPNHHNISVNYFIPFFYTNERNNFYVNSLGRVTKPPFDDIKVLSEGLLMSRNSITPLSPANLALTGSSSTTATGNHSIAHLSPGGEVLSNAGSAIFPPVFIGKHYAFQTFYHPYVCDLIKTLNTSGIDGLYKNIVLDSDGQSRDGIQNRVAKDIFIPNGAYNPTNLVQTPYPVEQVDFNYSGMYSIYNWELFFHIPLLIATRFSQNQKFEEARKWFHYIFDPTRSLSPGITGTEGFWITKPFKEEIGKGILPIEDLLNNASPDLDLQLNNWETNPFNPHAVARLRISAYMRSTVMKYIDNLIAWGDQLFRQDTLETINEATLLYILAANMLGKKPELVPARAIPGEISFSTIKDKLDSLRNAKVAVQSFFSLPDINSDDSIDSVMPSLFCIPKNDVLLGYWDTLADRLFKIRHCLNIEGIFQQLPLFEPPIDPALLVRATAAGLDLNSVLNDMNVSLPNYRFQLMLQKANELCNDVKGLGSELLSALEKRDAEQLALLRSGHELAVLKLMRDVKEGQMNEARENLDSLNASRQVIEGRINYYSGREFMNASEKEYYQSLTNSLLYQTIQAGLEMQANIAFAVPESKVGPPTTVGATFGGANIGNMLKAFSSFIGVQATLNSISGNMANVMGGHQRRQDDWKFLANSAGLELKQVDKQIAAAEIRLAIAEKELESHDLQIENTGEVDDYMRSKFTNADLYDYMVGQIAGVYFQSYQLAYNTAKKAEKCFQHELGIENTSFIQFGYWDSLKKGLLSGEKLEYDLRRLENAYLEKNKREMEITKHISLALINPLAILQLKEKGKSEIITLPEELFDLDFPGHYFRRIKSISVSIPCIAGPYTSVNAILRLKKNEYRVDKNATDAASYKKTPQEVTTPGTGRFRSGSNPVSSIATSSAQNDSGVFELNFRDERYLPFEGAGAASIWSLELMEDPALRQFDYETISDVILHLKYTASEGGDTFKDAAIANLKQVITDVTTSGMPLSILLDVRHEFSNEWHRFINSTNNIVQLELPVSKDRWPFFTANNDVQVYQITWFAKKRDMSDHTPISLNTNPNLSMTFDNIVNLFKAVISNISVDITAENGHLFLLPMNKNEVAKIDELFLLLNYTLT